MAEARDFRCSSHVVENFGKETIPSDHAAVRLVIQKPTHRGDQNKRIPSWMSKHPICSNFVTTTDSLLTHFARWPNLKFSYTMPKRRRNVSCQGKHLTASGQSF